jgi:hypothetical protein
MTVDCLCGPAVQTINDFAKHVFRKILPSDNVQNLSHFRE